VFDLPELFGIIIMMTLVGIIVYYGTTLVEKVLSFWSIILYAAFAIMFISVFIMFSNDISLSFSQQSTDTNWTMGGVKYAAYNIGLAPAILFCVRHFDSRKEALISGIFAGLIGMLPALVMFIAMLSQYPQIISETVPINIILENIGWTPFKFMFQIVLFGTFIETGVGLIHGFNERILSVKPDLLDSWRAIIGIFLLLISIFFANQIGLIGLIANGYGALTWGYWIIFVIPIITIGLKKILNDE
jgi:uncharacterized membrane protein YkvI